MLFVAGRVTRAVVLAAMLVPAGRLPAESLDLLPAIDEIRVDGTVASVAVAGHKLVVQAASFTLPDGRTSKLAVPKPKTVTVTDRTMLHQRRDDALALTLAELKPGLEVTALGSDLGSGKELPARLIVVGPPDSGERPTMILPRASREELSSLAFSPDGRWLAASNMAGSCAIWDVAMGCEARRLPERSAFEAEFSPDGRTLVTVGCWAGEKVTLSLWDTAAWTRRTLARLDAQLTMSLPVPNRPLAISADGRTVAYAQGDAVQLVDMATGKARALKTPAVDIALNAAGTLLAASGRTRGPVTLWDLRTGTQTKTIGEAGKVFAWSLSPDGSSLAAVDVNRPELVLWDTASGQQRTLYKNDEGYLYPNVRYAPDGRTLANNADKGLKLVDVGNGQVKAKLLSTTEARCVAFSRDGSLVATGHGNHKIVLWDTATGQVRARLGRLDFFQYVVNPNRPGLAFLPQLFRPWPVALWDCQVGSPLRRLPGQIGSLSFSPDGKLAATAEWGALTVWDAATWTERAKPAAPQTPAQSGYGWSYHRLAVSPDGRWLVAAPSGYPKKPKDKLQVWDLTAGGEPRELGEPTGLRWPEVDFSPDGRTLVSSFLDGLIVWNVPDFTERQRLPLVPVKLTPEQARFQAAPEDRRLPFAFSPDGRYLATNLSPGTTLWELATGKVARTVEGSQPTFSPDGRTLAVKPLWSRVACYDTATWQKQALTLRRYEARFSHDGRALLCQGAEGRLEFRDRATGQLRASLYLLDDGAEYLIVTPAGYYAGSPAATAAIRWLIGDRLAPAAEFQGQYLKPDQVTAAMWGG